MKKLIYKILEFFFKNGVKAVISGIQIRLPFRFYRYYERDYEAENISFFRKSIKRNDFVMDIGAQIGLMSKLFADLVGPNGNVFSFEPTPMTFGVLKQTLKLNGIENIVHPVQEAVSDKNGKAIFNISEIDIDASNSLTNLNKGEHVKGIEVNVTSIDEFVKKNLLKKVDFIKIDAEGAEYFVLVGATNTITEHRPIINLALHPAAINNFNSSLKEIYEFIIIKNYHIIYRSNDMNEKDFISKENLFDVQLLPNKI